MKHIAVVEDDSSASQQIQNYLSLYQKENEQEFSVTVFADGLSILEDYHPIWDIILMDIEMPLMDGMTAAKRIRELDQSVIIIFITNMASMPSRAMRWAPWILYSSQSAISPFR